MSDDGIFLRNYWYVAAWNHELIDGRKLARTILEKPVVIYRGASGRVGRSTTAAATARRRCRWAGSRATTSAACTTA
jgi:hypothetical protein